MSGFWSGLSGKLAERWLSLLALPGLLVLGTAVTAAALGHRRWHDVGLLATHIGKLAGEPAMRNTGAVILVLLGVLGGSAAVGLTVQAFGWAIERLWTGRWPTLVARPLVAWRRRRWTRATERYRAALIAKHHALHQRSGDDRAPSEQARPPDTQRLNDARLRIGLTEPACPTWIGDRIAAAQTRIRDHYDLDLVFAWPRLWLVVPDTSRAQLMTASGRFSASSRLVAWGLWYLTIGLWWWPSAVAGSVTVLVGWRLGRTSMDTLAHLVEAAVDVHGRELATALGIESTKPLTPGAGLQITHVVRKGA
ncbi:hypothetical protein [Nonomuraea diastatica]|uniref:Vegetative cell wall protein gp1 n=1 Tax=Nonomuraea diastatica TaxID=1848329 RepID=A0A4R4WKR2_9ACTN|nr:hypothetical protein [Nonomuraea diastatica]TDD19709.1 hypothetical protein E1294_20190 [Nonomuraea diastatica]